MSFYVYILECNDGSYYVGHTDNLEVRVSEHNHRKVDGYTAKRLPLRLVFTEEFSSREEAFNAERQIKGWNRKKKQALIVRDWEALIILSRLKKINLILV